MSFNLSFTDKIIEQQGSYRLGEESGQRITDDDILRMHQMFQSNSELYNLKEILPPTFYDIPNIYVLIIRNPVSEVSDGIYKTLINAEMCEEGKITGVNWDKQTLKKVKLANNKDNY